MTLLHSAIFTEMILRLYRHFKSLSTASPWAALDVCSGICVLTLELSWWDCCLKLGSREILDTCLWGISCSDSAEQPITFHHKKLLVALGNQPHWNGGDRRQARGDSVGSKHHEAAGQLMKAVWEEGE